jgi:hypothetical protein
MMPEGTGYASVVCTNSHLPIRTHIIPSRQTAISPNQMDRKGEKSSHTELSVGTLSLIVLAEKLPCHHFLLRHAPARRMGFITTTVPAACTCNCTCTAPERVPILAPRWRGLSPSPIPTNNKRRRRFAIECLFSSSFFFPPTGLLRLHIKPFVHSYSTPTLHIQLRVNSSGLPSRQPLSATRLHRTTFIVIGAT